MFVLTINPLCAAMKTLLSLLLFVHIAAGVVALLVGLVPMAAQKGTRLHRRTGLVYVWCMVVVAATAGLLCGLQPFRMMRLFLAGIAVFSFFLCMTGWRATKQKTGRTTPADRLLTYVALATGGGMVAFGTYLMALNGPTFLPVVFSFFGLLTSRFAWRDHCQYQRPTLKMGWFFQHFTRMGGSYIATFTAALVTNAHRFVPAHAPHWLGTLLWIAPSVLGGGLIGYTVFRYRKKFSARQLAPLAG